jgi:hypothetical protein
MRTEAAPRFGLPVLALAALAGCGNSAQYWASRRLDLWDVVPISVQRGYGLSVSARATPFAQSGLGLYAPGSKDKVASTNSFGMGLGRWGPRSSDGALHVVIGSMEYQELRGPPWPGGPDGRYEQSSTAEKRCRASGNAFIVFPAPGVTDPPSGEFANLPRWYFWPDCEAHVFLGLFGIRVGFSPAQLVDFLAGIFGLDPLGDDLPATISEAVNNQASRGAE